MKERAIKAFEESASVKQQFVRDHADCIVQVVKLIATAFREGRKVLLFGNGGSATDAAHIAAEFVGRYHRERAPLPAIALATDVATITCIANDYGYDELFARQILAHGQKGDIAIAISTSGNSSNVLKGVEAARAIGLTTIAWTGGTGGKLAGMVEYAFVVPSKVTALGHVLCELIEEQLLGKTS
jgi:D-sedoheptulose 7-phosphate isomerase